MAFSFHALSCRPRRSVALLNYRDLCFLVNKKGTGGILSVSSRKSHKSPLTPVTFSIKKLQIEDDYDLALKRLPVYQAL